MKFVSVLAQESEDLNKWPRWDESSKNTVLDISLLNEMDATAAITEVTFHIRNVWLTEVLWKPAQRSVSWTRHVVLPITGTRCAISVGQVFEDVPPKGTNRFQLEVGNDQPGTYDWFIFQVAIEIEFNGDDSVTSDDIIFISPSAAIPVAMNTNAWRAAKAIVFNYHRSLEIAATGAEQSQFLEAWVEDVQSAPDELVDRILNAEVSEKERLESLEFLTMFGAYFDDAVELLRSDQSEFGVAFVDAVSSALQKIDAAPVHEINTSFYRRDGHSGCSPAWGMSALTEADLDWEQISIEIPETKIDSNDGSTVAIPAEFIADMFSVYTDPGGPLGPPLNDEEAMADLQRQLDQYHADLEISSVKTLEAEVPPKQ